MRRLVVFAALPAVACAYAHPDAEIHVTAAVDLPELGDEALLEIRLDAVEKDAASALAEDPTCLADEAGCTISLSMDGLGRGGVDGLAWLDVAGDDGGDVYHGIVDGSPVGVFHIDIPDLPYVDPVEVVLDDPAVTFPGETGGT